MIEVLMVFLAFILAIFYASAGNCGGGHFTRNAEERRAEFDAIIFDLELRNMDLDKLKALDRDSDRTELGNIIHRVLAERVQRLPEVGRLNNLEYEFGPLV